MTRVSIAAWVFAAAVVMHSAPTAAQEDARITGLRAATGAFHDVGAAEAAGYARFGHCFTNPGTGDMGIHWANERLIGTPGVDSNQPELLVYVPQESGALRLAALEYIVFRDDWHAAGNAAVPALFGQTFKLDETTLDRPFYKLHVWLWQDNPGGMFADWNAHVKCPAE